MRTRTKIDKAGRLVLPKERDVWVYRCWTPVSASISKLIGRQRDQRIRKLIATTPLGHSIPKSISPC